MPSVKHRAALKALNQEVVEGQGLLKINFTDLADDIFFDQVDDRIRVLLRHFRISICNSHGVAKQRRLYSVLDAASYANICAVFAEFADVLQLWLKLSLFL